MFSRIFCFFLISCIYNQINCAPGRNRNEDSDFTFSSDKVRNDIDDEFHEVKDAVDTTAEDAKRSFNDNYEKGKDTAEKIADNVQHTLEGERQEQVGLLQNVVDKLKDEASNFVEGTKNIANKVYDSGANAFKNTRESVRNSVDKSLQSTGKFFNAGVESSKDNLATLFTIAKAPFKQSTDFMYGLMKD